MFKLEYELIEFAYHYCFAVTHQEGEAPRCFKASNGVEVRSQSAPDICTTGIYVRGANVNKNDEISVRRIENVNHTIGEYHQALEEYIVYANECITEDFEVTPEKLEKWYKEGTLLRTRENAKTRIICIDKKHDSYPVVVLIYNEEEDYEYVTTYTSSLQFVNSEDSSNDIVGLWNE